MAKLWKGIFYCESGISFVSVWLRASAFKWRTDRNRRCRYRVPLPALKGFWMSDKALVQQALAQELSDLVLAVPETSRGAGPSAGEASGDTLTARARGGLALLEGFWDAMTREWSGLDKWR